MNAIEEGIHLGMPEDEYRKAPGVNVSSLKKMLLSPAHYKHALEEQESDKHNSNLIIGTLVHRAKLEPDRLCYAVRPDKWDSWRTDASKAWRDAQTLPVVTPDEEQTILRCVDSITGLEIFDGVTIDDLCAAGNTEVTCFKRHKRTGLMLKGRADLVATDDDGITWIVDLKTVPEEGASPDAFARKIADLNYHMQAAHYCDLFETDRFIFIAVEKKGYAGVASYMLSGEDLELGRRTNNAALQKLAECRATNIWPGYSTKLQTIQLPQWKRKQEMADVL